MANHTPDRSYLIQTYMTLHSQQTNVRRRLSQDSAASSTASSPSSPSSSPVRCSQSPPRRNSRSSRSPTMLSSSPPSRRSSIETIPELPEHEHSTMIMSNDEIKLADISNRIKMTLTDLLNCEGVKGDMRMRNWVATRLMDVEHELKESKRRRNSVDAEQVRVIAASLR
ncbi:hypothetical protein BDV97DRAFT_394266 [Delphinella strobiligena]|nr:hypothetical protein BDV97DRAFT_394266 [Delphinella strobiligena]